MKTRVENFKSTRAFSIVEVLVSVAVLALLGTGAIAGLLSINRTVMSSRVATNAQAIAQSRIDRILAEPYADGSPTPVELEIGTTTQSDVPIYTDPVFETVVVAGTITTTVNDISRTIVANAPAPKLFQATVAVSYVYGGRPANITVTTVRTVD
jgi:type II secretory pathway pseudopilin PulG